MLREDNVEEKLVSLLTKLVCPSQEIIQWVADAMRQQYKEDIESKEKVISSIQSQIERIDRMDESLYDDKLSGDISTNKYKEKHEQFMNQKAEFNDRLNKIDLSFSKQLEKQLVLLELSQKAPNYT